jgi:hypothetical protein
MVTIAISWVYITFLCLGMGWLFLCGVKKLTGDSWVSIPITALPFLGLAIISAMTSAISIFAPIRWHWNILYIVLIMVGVVVVKMNRQVLAHWLRLLLKQWQVLVFLIPCILILLLKCACVVDIHGVADSVFHSDSGYYHAQSIRWIEEYGLVPGLGNLLPPLAIDYLWFQPCALFGFSDFLPQRLHSLTGLLVAWAITFSVEGVIDLMKARGKGGYGDIFRMLLLIPLFEIANYVNSDSGDEPAAVMVLIAMAMMIMTLEKWPPDQCEGRKEPSGKRIPHLSIIGVALLTAFAIGIKLSVLPLLLVVLFLAFKASTQKQWHVVAGIILVCSLILLPKLVRTVFLSGYLVYPFPALDLFHVDWKMPSLVLTTEKGYVESMARMRFAEPGAMISGGIKVWFPSWFIHFLKTPLAIALQTSIVLMIGGLIFLRKTTKEAFLRLWPVYGTLGCALTYWFVMAPDVRFGYGFLASSSILLALPTVGYAFEKGMSLNPSDRSIRFILLVSGILYVAGIFFSIPHKMPGDSFGRGMEFSNFYRLKLKRTPSGKTSTGYLVYQDPYPNPELLQFTLGGMKLYRPATGMHCWDSPLPATPFLYNRIEMRGYSLRDGFRAIDGSVGDFPGTRLANEWKTAQEKQKKSDSEVKKP